jgi:hypothetical protein
MKKGRRFFIPAPICLCKSRPKVAGIGDEQENTDPEREKKICLDAVNYREMNKALDLLSGNKGLELAISRRRTGGDKNHCMKKPRMDGTIGLEPSRGFYL